MTDDSGGGHSERFWLLVTGILLVTMPAFTLVFAYTVLLATRSTLVERVSPVEIVELYLVELVAFALFGYVLYRLTQYSSFRYRQMDTDEAEDE